MYYVYVGIFKIYYVRIVLKKGKYFTAFIHLACVCMCAHTYVLACACTKVYVWKSKNLQKSVFSFYQACPGD